MTSGTDDTLTIVKATLDDIDDIKRIADAHKNELGFIRRPALLDSIKRSEVYVARQNGVILGFVEYRHRRDKQTTLHNIVVNSQYRKCGIGRSLVQSLITDAQEAEKDFVLLKCPEDLVANDFYASLGFKLDGTEAGKQRKLNVWCLQL